MHRKGDIFPGVWLKSRLYGLFLFYLLHFTYCIRAQVLAHNSFYGTRGGQSAALTLLASEAEGILSMTILQEANLLLELLQRSKRLNPVESKLCIGKWGVKKRNHAIYKDWKHWPQCTLSDTMQYLFAFPIVFWNIFKNIFFKQYFTDKHWQH